MAGGESTGVNSFAEQYRDLINRRVTGRCAEPGCGNLAERYFRCAEHAPSELIKRVRPKRLKQAIFRLKLSEQRIAKPMVYLPQHTKNPIETG